MVSAGIVPPVSVKVFAAPPVGAVKVPVVQVAGKALVVVLLFTRPVLGVAG